MELRKWLLENAFTSDGSKISGHLAKKNPEVAELLRQKTSFFDDSVPLSERVFAILNDQTGPFICVQCGLKIPFKKGWTSKLYCSIGCLNKSVYRLKKTQNTNTIKYGSVSPAGNKDIQTKMQETCLVRYGQRNAGQVEFVQEKMKRTNIERRGVKYTWEDPAVREKSCKTLDSRYGVCNAAFIQGVKTKKANTLKMLYGVDHYSKSHNPEAFTLLEDRKWLHEQHIILKKSLTTIAAELGVYTLTVSKAIHEAEIPVQYHSAVSEGESWLKTLLQGYNVEFNCRKVIPPYELVFYLPNQKLAIEYCGLYWHTESRGRDRNYHLRKTQLCLDKGIELLHIFSSDNRDIWESVIRAKLGSLTKIGARETEVRQVDRTEMYLFLSENHLQGPVDGPIRLGLFYHDELVSVMCFSRSRFDKRYDYELLRFCSKKGLQIVGGASKLLKYSGVSNCISYANRRWSNGQLYQALGFQFINETPPNYFYTRDFEVLLSRQQFQKHLLQKKLDHFDPKLTEYENMLRNGYDRVWDCGNKTYILS